MKKAGLAALALTLLCAYTGTAYAQKDKMTPIAIPAQPTAIALDTGALPGATAQESWHSHTTACSPAT